MRMRQALLALLDNVRKHATPGQVRISTTIRNGTYYLAVEDEGPGIDSHLARHVFDAFQRGDHAQRRGGTGSGLGLAVVKAIAVAHGGQVSCRPSPLGGTVFELALPHTVS
jgi:two-component system sensor histidine kinase AdeS